MIVWEDARARLIECDAGQCNVIRCNVERIECERLYAPTMGVIAGPQRDARPLSDGDTLFDLQPAKDHMQVWFSPHILVDTAALFDAPEPAIKEEYIARPRTLILEMPFRRARLPKDRLPARQPGNARKIQIRIEMYRHVRGDLAARQIIHNLGQPLTIIHNILIARNILPDQRFRNWQRAKFARWEDRAGNFANAGIEALATENDFHKKSLRP